MIRAVVDANVIISSVIAPLGAPRRIFDAWRQREFELVTSPGIIEEVARKLIHPKIRTRYHLSDEDTSSVIGLLRTQAVLTPGMARVAPGSRDPSDNKVIATAVEADAAYVVSGDKDLLTLERHGRIAIVTPAKFVDLLRR